MKFNNCLQRILFSFVLTMMTTGTWADSDVFISKAKLENDHGTSSINMRFRVLSGGLCEVYSSEDEVSGRIPAINNDITGVVTIPEYAEGYKVTWIGDYAFQNCKCDFILPSTIEKIGQYAFYGCSSTSVDIQTGVKTIGMDAFSSSSIRKIRIPGTVTNMSAAFRNCQDLQSVTIDEGVTKISPFAFYNSRILSVVLPSTITEIANNAFYNCTTIKEFILSNPIPPTISDNAFAWMEKAILYVPDRTAYNTSPWTTWFRDIISFLSPVEQTHRYSPIKYNSGDYNAWGLFIDTDDPSLILSVTADGVGIPVKMKNRWLIVSEKMKTVPRVITYLKKTDSGIVPYTVNYHVMNYGIYIDGQELTSLNMFDIPGIKSGKAHLEDVPLGSGENYYVWGRYPTLVLEDAVIESEGIAIYNEDNVDFKIDVTGDCTISSKKENALELDIATNTTIQGGGTLHMFTLSEGYDAIESWAVAHLIVQDNTTLIVESNYGAAYYERDDAIFEIYNGGVFCARSKNYVSVAFDNTENNVLGDGIALRYPVGAYVKKHGVCYADGSEVSKDWVVFGPEGAAPPVEENSITTAIGQVQSSSQSEAAEPSAKLKVQSDGWYTIDGRRLSGKPNTKGVYIHNGRAVVH